MCPRKGTGLRRQHVQGSQEHSVGAAVGLGQLEYTGLSLEWGDRRQVHVDFGSLDVVQRPSTKPPSAKEGRRLIK